MNLRKYFKAFKLSDEKSLQEVQLSQQQISHIIAALFVCLFFIFMAGYYWGKKTAVEHFANQLESDSLADKVSYAFVSLYDASDEPEEDDQPEEADGDDNGMALTAAEVSGDGQISSGVNSGANSGVNTGSAGVNSSAGVSSGTTSNSVDSAKLVKLSGAASTGVSSQSQAATAPPGEKGEKVAKPKHEYFAQLAGFGASRTARSYAEILTKKGYGVKVVERKSKTARGKQTSWYQVVTPSYTDKDKLLELVEKIKRVTPIGAVKIVSVDIE